MQLLRQMPEYQQATASLESRKFTGAHRSFQEILTILDRSKQKETLSYLHILKQMAHANMRAGETI
jgi:hypothetical protein